MKAIAQNQKSESKMRKRKQLQKKEKEWKLKNIAEIKRLEVQSRKSIEKKKLKKLFPNSIDKPIIFSNLHPNFRAAFNRKCKANNCTATGKIRYFMWETINDRIDHEKMNNLLSREISLRDFSPISEKIPHVIVMKGIPMKLHKEFKKWCVLRGLTMTGKIKSMMNAYLKNIIE